MATRVSRRFSWSEVDPRVLRSFLRAVYKAHGDEVNAAKLRKASTDALVETAKDRLGTPPPPRVFSPQVYEALRTDWLPLARKEVVNRLATTVRSGLSGAALAAPCATKGQQIEFLRRRNLTTNLCTNLRASFIASHKLSVEVERSATGMKEYVGGVLLKGVDEAVTRVLYPHQVTAIGRLNELLATGDLRGRLVLPTGAGKTDTVVAWLLPLLAADPSLRVLWLVHQQELATQALHRFVALSRSQPQGFTRRCRVISSGASALSVLVEDDLDVVTATYQGFRGLDVKKRRLLDTYLHRPTIVIVDEAHHAGSPTYDKLLETVEGAAAVRAVVGLTATPFPSGAGAARRFETHFPTLVHSVSSADLVLKGILAQPILTAVDTGQCVDITDSQAAAATSSDIPIEVLSKLDEVNRNRLVVSTWEEDRDEWGKTLVFATRIAHADGLAKLFAAAGADVRTLHSGTVDRGGTLAWFRGKTGSAVLVSVGMLTEGVDLPDARSAFLARPTTSPILMRQMVGRVLRGPHAGGDEDAHIVHFRDEWTNLADVLEPAELLEGWRRGGTGRDNHEWTPGDIVDDAELAIRGEVLAKVERSFAQLKNLFNVDDANPYNDHPPEPLLEGAHLVGHYEIGDMVVPVFGHQQSGYETLLSDAIENDLKGTAFLSYFEDGPPPFPSQRALQVLVAFAREAAEVPLLEPAAATVGPEAAAHAVLDAGQLSEADRAEMILQHYQRSINRVAYPTAERFEEAVNLKLRDLRRHQTRLDPERSPSFALDPSALPRLRRADRDLGPITKAATERARHLLPAMAPRLMPEPSVEWTRKVAATTFGHWTLKLSGKGRGKSIIRINRLFRTNAMNVPDEMLEYLIYHELLHHLLPGQSHDAEFRELEALWPDADRLDLAFDTFHEKWDTRPESYASDVG